MFSSICIQSGFEWWLGPWCAVTERGDGDVHWDCKYHSIEECVPNVLVV